MVSQKNLIWAFFTKFLTPGLTSKLGNPLDVWLDRLILTNHLANHLIRRLIQELKILWIRALVFSLIFICPQPTFFLSIKHLLNYLVLKKLHINIYISCSSIFVFINSGDIIDLILFDKPSFLFLNDLFSSCKISIWSDKTFLSFWRTLICSDKQLTRTEEKEEKKYLKYLNIMFNNNNNKNKCLQLIDSRYTYLLYEYQLLIVKFLILNWHEGILLS